MTHAVTKQATVVRTELSTFLRLLRESDLPEKSCWAILASHILAFFRDAGSWVPVPERNSYLTETLKENRDGKDHEPF